MSARILQVSYISDKTCQILSDSDVSCKILTSPGNFCMYCTVFVSLLDRYMEVTFKIFATQPWHVGRYYLEVIPSPENCVYQRETDDLCFSHQPITTCQTRVTSNRIDFQVQLLQNHGWPTFDPEITLVENHRKIFTHW